MKKFLISLLAFAMTFSVLGSGAAAQETSASTSPQNITVDVDLTDLTPEKIKDLNENFTAFQINPVYSGSLRQSNSSDDIIIRPMAIEIVLDKPIAGWGYIPNSRFYAIIEHNTRYGNILNAVQNYLQLGLTNRALDMANILSGSIAGWGIHPFTQYLNTGVDYYAVSVYANGKPNSLSTIQYRYFSAAPLLFTYR